MFNNLRELILSMPTEEACRDYLVQQRWNGKPVCPYCGSGKSYRIENGKRYKCGDSKCYKKYSVTVGTIMEASNIPLVKWFTAIYLSSAHKKGISSYQLGKDIGVSQKCAWFMLHRIREMMRVKDNIKLDNIVEIDEVYIGGKVGNMSKSKRTQLREQGLSMRTKTMVMGLIERGGSLKLITIGKTNNYFVMIPTVKANVDKEAVIITDSLSTYHELNKTFAGHQIVNHADQEYVRDKTIHTNSIEGAFSLLKRSIIGIYHQVTPKHLSRYCDETMFRYNLRKMKDANRFTYSLQNIEGRLKYKHLIQKDDKDSFTALEKTVQPIERKKGQHWPIQQILHGEVIATFKTVVEAQQVTGIAASMIRRVLLAKKYTTHGYQFRYADNNGE
jgi:transposase-like protein